MAELDLNLGGYLIDLDGTLISGNTVLPEACRLLDAVAGRYVIVSNNAEHMPDQLSRRLKSMGLAVPAERIVLAGAVAIDEIAASTPGAAVLLLGSQALKRHAVARGLRLDARVPDIVLVTRDRQFSYAKLAAAVDAIAGGASLVVAAPDFSHPGPGGRPVPETGALAAAILACVGAPGYTVIGKPERILFDIGCRRLGIDCSDAIMIGDNPSTDGLGARRLGMRFHQVHRGAIGLALDLAAA